VLQSGERWYLNLLVSETARRSRITSAAAAKLGRGSVHDKRMHLRDVNGTEVSITVDVIVTTKELLEGAQAPKPHMVLIPGDERRIQGMMLTGWMGKADLLKGWASQGKRKDRPASEARGRGAGDQAYFKHLKVKTDGRTLLISALFDRNVPDTTVGYGAATILGLKGGRTRRWVTTAEGNQRLSYAWYKVPLQDMGGHTKQVKASGVLRTARVMNEGKDGEAYGDSPGGATGPAREWECINLTIGRDNMDCKPEGILGWHRWPRVRLPCEGHRGPRRLRQGGGQRSHQKELGGSRVLTSSRQGSVWHLWCEHFYRLLYSPRDTEKGGRRGKRHSTDKHE
jgi:hypothetical protein